MRLRSPQRNKVPLLSSSITQRMTFDLYRITTSSDFPGFADSYIPMIFVCKKLPDCSIPHALSSCALASAMERACAIFPPHVHCRPTLTLSTSFASQGRV